MDLTELVSKLQTPKTSQHVYREECTQCFDNQDGPEGIDVCLSCFNGSCPAGSTNAHALLHAQKTGHQLVVNIKRTKKPVAKSKRDSNEPPIKKLAIREEPAEHEKYDFTTSIKRIVDGTSESIETTPKLDELAKAVSASMSSAQKSEVKAWEEEIVSCTHTTSLVQPNAKTLEPAGLASCAHEGCGLTNNLWLCLICGSLGCGRQQYGGGGGNGHGVLHTQTTGHSVAVKMGTIEPEGTADIYCYACDDARLDPQLSKHLATFGIEVAAQKKTEKSMTELQVEQNLSFDFAMTGEDGKDAEPLFGPGLTGLRNLGNSCYMASSLQTLFALPSFQERYMTSFYTHVPNCTNPSPATCFECQMAKVADGLLSGRYAVPREADKPISHPEGSTPPLTFQDGIRPNMFKALVGKDHPEFSTMKQQDAGEFLVYLLENVKRSAKASGEEDPTKLFSFALEERLQCQECLGVKYKTVGQEALSVLIPAKEKTEDGDKDVAMSEADKKEKEKEYLPVELMDCLDRFTSPTEVEFRCPSCDKNVKALKTTTFATFPDVLILTAVRFIEGSWVPKKVDVPVLLDSKQISLDKLLGLGKQEGEHDLPEAKEDAAVGPVFDAEAMAQLTGMGFPEIRCQRALLATGNSGAEAAMNWLFGHMEDPDIDDPLPAAAGASTAAEPDAEVLEQVVSMGFSPLQARKALRETGGDAARAVDWLFSHPDDDGSDTPAAGGGADAAPIAAAVAGSSKLPANYRLKSFISHKGPSVHSGHYVAHVLTESGWVLFNDEKVVKADVGAQGADKLMPLAYVYIFERR